MKTGSSAPRVWLNPAAVWEAQDRLDTSQNQLALRSDISLGHLSLLMNGKRCAAPLGKIKNLCDQVQNGGVVGHWVRVYPMD